MTVLHLILEVLIILPISIQHNYLNGFRYNKMEIKHYLKIKSYLFKLILVANSPNFQLISNKRVYNFLHWLFRNTKNCKFMSNCENNLIIF